MDDDTKYTANYFWKILVGAEPQVLSIDENTDLSKISAIAKAATQVPAIGASKTGFTPMPHGFAILGIQGSKIQLYNPHGEKLSQSLEDFRKNFNYILSGRSRS